MRLSTPPSHSPPSRASSRVADLLLFVIVCLVYASVATTSYAFLDDYPLLASALRHDGWTRSLNLQMGRPVAAWLMDTSFNSIDAVAELRWLRLGGVLGFALAAIILRRIATRAGWDLWTACCIALLLVTLPSVQVYVSWTTLWFYPYIISLVAAALLLLDRALSAPSRSRLLAAASLSTAILILVGLTYQPMLFLYIPLFLLRYWAVPGVWTRVSARIAALHAAVLGTAIGVCFVIFKLGAQPSARGAMTTNWPGKLTWFLNNPLRNAFNLYHLDVGNFPRAQIIATLVCAIILAGSLVAYWRYRPGPVALACTLVLPLAIVAAYTPTLLVAENWAAYRSAYAISCTTLVAFFWGLYQLVLLLDKRPRLWQSVAGVLALLACLLAQFQTHTLFAIPQQREFDLLTTQLSQLPLKLHDRVLLIQPENYDSCAWIQLYDEFGIPSSCVSWVPETMFWIALRQTHPDLTIGGGSAITFTFTHERPANPDADFVIDMKKMLLLLRP